MYVKIRTDGAVGIGKGTEGSAEITLGYGEAHMIAAALDKLAQTARSYKQIYKKTTDVGGGHKIELSAQMKELSQSQVMETHTSALKQKFDSYLSF